VTAGQSMSPYSCSVAASHAQARGWAYASAMTAIETFMPLG
jgi:hypothetical protein